MPAPNSSTFDGNPNASPAVTTGYRPGASDFNGAALSNDTSSPPDPDTMPTAELLNTMSLELVSVGRMVASAYCAINAGASPTFQAWATAANTVSANPFSIKRNAAGDYQVTWSAAASTWQASTANSATYPNQSFVTPTTAHANGFYFVCTTAGSSGSTEPTWPSTIGSTVSDGTAVWTCWGPTLAVGLPTSGWPKGHLNVIGGAHSYGIQVTLQTGGIVRVTTQQDGVLTDLNFSVDIY